MRITNHKEQQKQFIQLRAQGKSYSNISEELGISKSSCSNWGKRYAAEIIHAAQLQNAKKLPKITKENSIPNQKKPIGNLVFNKTLDNIPVKPKWVSAPYLSLDKQSITDETDKEIVKEVLEYIPNASNSQFTEACKTHMENLRLASQSLGALIKNYAPVWEKLDKIVDEVIENIPPEEKAKLHAELIKREPRETSEQSNLKRANIKSLLHAYTFNKFAAILSNNVTAQLTTINTIVKKPNIDEVTGNGTITLGNGFVLHIENYDRTSREWKTSVHKLLHIATLLLTKNNHSGEKNLDAINCIVKFTVNDYLELKNTSINQNARKEAKAIIRKDIDTLEYSSIDWKEKKRGKNDKSRSFINTPIIGGSSGVSRNGEIVITFSREFAGYLVGEKFLIQYALALLQTDERNPNTYPLGYKLLYHNSMDSNLIRGTANIISVKKALENCPSIPTYQELKSKKDRHWERKIKDALEKALDSLPFIMWEYCKAKNEPLTDEELEITSYSFFSDLYIHFEVIDAPDQAQRIQAKTKIANKRKTKKNRQTNQKHL